MVPIAQIHNRNLETFYNFNVCRSAAKQPGLEGGLKGLIELNLSITFFFFSSVFIFLFLFSLDFDGSIDKNQHR